MTEPNCIFCQIIAGQIPVEKLLENDLVLVFNDAAPSAETHMLIVPRAHVTTFMDLDDDKVTLALKNAAQQLIREKKLTGAYKLVINGGSYQHIPHLHWHLLGGKLTAHP